MKKVLLALILLPGLSGCPEQSKNNTQIPAPSGTAVPPLSAFPQQSLSCCWDDLVKKNPTYAALALSALNGQEADLQKLLDLTPELELPLSYGHGAVLAEILVRLGDERFAYVMQQLNLEKNNVALEEKLFDSLRNALEGGFSLTQNAAVKAKSLQDYPLSAGLLSYTVEAKAGT